MEIIIRIISILDPLFLAFLLIIFAFLVLFHKIFFSTLYKLKFISNFINDDLNEKWYGQITGSIFVSILALIANNFFVYLIAVIVIATLVTEMEFLLKIITLIWNRTELAQTMLSTQNQEKPTNVDTQQIITLVKKLEDQGKQIEQVQNEKKFHLLTEYFFETYSFIFGSQIQMLRMIESLPNKIATKQMVENFYFSTTWKEKYPFYDYTDFLIKRKLIEHDYAKDVFSLTEVGQTFLSFIKNRNLNEFKQPF